MRWPVVGSQGFRCGNFCVGLLILAILGFLWCEFFVYYAVIYSCSWPVLNGGENDGGSSSALRALFVADTHLLGPFRGHWFDKLRREWQMHRAFQTAVTIHQPEVVFFLGDLFDEGHWVDKDEFKEYVARFGSLFHVPDHVEIYVVPGNHDMGFHYELFPELNNRFNRAFNTTSVRLLRLKGSSFVLINSMAMEEDKCFLCHAAEVRLRNLAVRFRCEKDPSVKECHSLRNLSAYSRPIILQHFPMYRKSDMACTEPDSAPDEEKEIPFQETLECLSKSSTNFLLKSLEPRLVISGHTHHGCLVHHGVQGEVEGIPEYSVPSFSWRNRNNPSFMMGVITPQDFVLSKCFIPEESTVVMTYILGMFALLFSAVALAFFQVSISYHRKNV